MPNIIGIGNSQAPTNAMLGGLAYQDSVGEIDIDKIKARTGDTAVDIFVYDTRKDSDGGAWRHRTQNKSWYNEDVSKSRGARKEFPVVAVIVAKYEELTIYDGDDPNLPMWMNFYYGSSTLSNITMLYANGNGVSALNGVICSTGSDGWHDGVTIIDFIADNAQWRNDSYIAKWDGGIATRNDAGGYRTFLAGGDQLITSAAVYEVTMTVLPNAPIDFATGIQIPTIVLATSKGVCVIRDDRTIVDANRGTVIDLNDSLGSTRPVRNVVIRGNDVVYWNINNGTIQQFFDAFSYTADSANEVRYNYTTSGGHASMENISAVLRNSGDGPFLLTAINPKSIATAAESGMSIFVDGITRTYSAGNNSIFDSRVAYVTSDYNTGWMHGDIKNALLSSTDTTDATYSTVADDWATAGAWTKQPSITISSTGSGTSGTLSISGNGTGSNVYFFNPITVEANTDYVVSITFGAENANTFVINTTQYNAGTGVLLDINALSGLTRGGHFNSGSNTTLYIQGWQTSTSATTITNLVIQKVSEKDRSVKNKGIIVYGTVPKQPVAAGAELVSYGPFSTSNRLQQPYNSDLQFGTNGFSVMFWFKSSATGSEQFIRKGNPSDDVGCFECYITAVGGTGNIRFVIKHTDGSSATVLNAATQGWGDGRWHHYVGVRRADGSMELYLDGILNNKTTTTHSVTNAESILDVGSVGTVANGAVTTFLSLLKITGTTPPSPEQIKKIYDDEKCLYHENAKCTLYGTSDTVTALAYDDTKNILHAGTSSGRSEFQGLNRINNTTVGITSSISASDGLVAEQ